MRPRLVVATVIALAFAVWGAPAASARDAWLLPFVDSSSSSSTGATADRGTEASFTQIPVRVRGDLAVQFHGDRATGCAARGLCGFSGTVIWQPPSTGMLEADTFRFRGKTEYDVSLQFSGGLFGGPSVQGGATTADVRFAPNGSAGSPSVCTDAAATGNDIEMPVNFRAASITLGAATPSLLGTRCAGPLQSDVANILPRRIVDVATLSNGRTGVSLVSSADFAVHGLAGTVSSTIQLRLGRPQTDQVSSGSSSPKTQRRFRTVVLSYRAHLDGTVLTHMHGDPASCAPLGSCGANGTLDLSVHSTPGTLAIGAVTRARRPLRDVLTALGLRGDGNPRGIDVIGIFFVRGRARYAVDVTQGGSTCMDSGPGGLDALFLGVTRGRVSAALGFAQPAPHLRCPGPMVPDASAFASGTARIRPLARHGGTIHLTTGGSFKDDGYTGRTVPDLTLTMSRPKLIVSNDALQSRPPG
ncbi:MAG: hypothetical protein ACXVEW_07030 [Solirubrobacteraceae bacterium]